MSEYTYTNCGHCGDRYPYDATHECWAYAKLQTQEDLKETCPICFEPVTTPHWRCFDDGIKGSSDVLA